MDAIDKLLNNDEPTTTSTIPGSLETNGLIDITTSQLLYSVIPLAFLALLSYTLELELTSPIIVGSIRTFGQLSLLGLILNPIFHWGVDLWWVVAGYVLFMVVLASNEAASRAQYFFPGVFIKVLSAMVISVGVVSVFAFGAIVQASPPWDPQYVIPICGMLLGNCVSGVSLALDATLTSLVESCREVELYLSFGASIYEASSRLMKEAVRSGAMPQLNSMAIIGLVSIPGMMTGQILGGAPVMAAAKYQILIMYFIGFCAFGNIFAVVFIAIRAGFDTKSHSLRTEHFVKRGKRKQCPGQVADCVLYPFQWCFSGSNDGEYDGRVKDANATKGELELLNEANNNNVPKKIRIYTLHHPSTNHAAIDDAPHALEIKGVSRSVPFKKTERLSSVSVSSTSSDTTPIQRKRTLFADLNATVKRGEIVAVSGPSGAGKSQLLRIISGLTSPDTSNASTTDSDYTGGGDVLLHGRSARRKNGGRPSYDMPSWRQKVRYVTQYKVDIPGTPRDFMNRIISLHSWQKKNKSFVEEEYENEDIVSYHIPPDLVEMENTTLKLLQDWGIESPNVALDSEWTSLSGGESQRVILALALASRPSILLSDESTSGLDLNTKIRVEKTILFYVERYGMSVMMSTHDEEQIERIMAHDG